MKRLVHSHSSLRGLYLEFLSWGVLLGAILVFLFELTGGGGSLWEAGAILAAGLMVSALILLPLLKAPVLVQCCGFPLVAIVLPFVVIEGYSLWKYGDLFPPGPLPAALLGSIGFAAMLVLPSLLCAGVFYVLHQPVQSLTR